MTRPRPVALLPSLAAAAVLLAAVATAVGLGGARPADGAVLGGVPPLASHPAVGSATPAAPRAHAGASRAPGASSGPLASKSVGGAARPVPSAAPQRWSLVVDHCVDRDVPAPAASDIVLTVLDRTYALPPDYAPDDLVPASEAGFTGASGERLIRAVVLPDLAAMHDAMRAAGLTIALDSAYRSYATQDGTFRSWVARLGEGQAVARSARPGHSEHQLGTTIDVTSPGWSGRFGDWAADTPEGAWMAEHAWEYGFVMSYPWGSEADTCFSYEPWHYRWIGRDAAAAHRASGLHLRQFLERFLVDG